MAKIALEFKRNNKEKIYKVTNEKYLQTKKFQKQQYALMKERCREIGIRPISWDVIQQCTADYLMGTSAEYLREDVCAVCHERVQVRKCQEVCLKDIPHVDNIKNIGGTCIREVLHPKGIIEALREPSASEQDCISCSARYMQYFNRQNPQCPTCVYADSVSKPCVGCRILFDGDPERVCCPNCPQSDVHNVE
jgi:hypothetical protein